MTSRIAQSQELPNPSHTTCFALAWESRTSALQMQHWTVRTREMSESSTALYFPSESIPRICLRTGCLRLLCKDRAGPRNDISELELILPVWRVLPLRLSP